MQVSLRMLFALSFHVAILLVAVLSLPRMLDMGIYMKSFALVPAYTAGVYGVAWIAIRYGNKINRRFWIGFAVIGTVLHFLLFFAVAGRHSAETGALDRFFQPAEMFADWVRRIVGFRNFYTKYIAEALTFWSIPILSTVGSYLAIRLKGHSVALVDP